MCFQTYYLLSHSKTQKYIIFMNLHPQVCGKSFMGLQTHESRIKYFIIFTYHVVVKTFPFILTKKSTHRSACYCQWVCLQDLGDNSTKNSQPKKLISKLHLQTHDSTCQQEHLSNLQDHPIMISHYKFISHGLLFLYFLVNFIPWSYIV